MSAHRCNYTSYIRIFNIENNVDWQVFDSLDYDEKGLANGYDAFGCLLELGVYVPVVDIPAILKVRL